MLSTNNRRTSYRDKLFLLFAFVFSATLGFLFFKNLSQTSAVHAAYAGFDAGNIISDGVMSDYNSMSEADIQNFLKSKNPCNDTNLSKANGYWHLNYHVENGHFVCMADERFDGESAAHIIWQAAQDYHINPRVLIVLLQKEQGLVTDTWPNFNLQYRSATGYGCPDTAACDSQYYGFRNQVRNAAELYRYILDYGSAYYPVGNRNVKYNPSGDCGSSIVNIQNRATSALYQYTPYQPNGAVLDAGPGIVVNCGAYGNVNFYYYFTQWFGSTQGGVELKGITLPEESMQLKTGSGLALSFDGTENGASAIIANSNVEDKLQQFQPIHDGKYYRFKNISTGRFLDLYNMETYDGTKIELWDGNDSCAQKWLVQENGSGYRLISACASEVSTRSVDVYGGNTGAVGNPVKLWSDNESAAQRWALNSTSSGPVDNGTYEIKSTDGKALTASSEYPGDGTGMIIWENTTSTAEDIKITRRSDGFYRLQNNRTDKSIDVDGGGTDDGTKVQLWSNNESCAQKWIVERSGARYRFVNACSGKSLDINGGKVNTNNTKVQLWSSNDSNAQEWSLDRATTYQPIADGEYNINSSLDFNYRLDVNGASAPRDGTNVQVWLRNNTGSQKYTIRFDTNTGYYTIYNPYSNRYLDAAEGGNNGGNTYVYSATTACPQRWILIPSASNTYRIASACTRTVIDISGGIASNGSNVAVYSDHAGLNQRWAFTPANEQLVADGTYYLESGINSGYRLDVNGASTPKNGTNVQIWSKNNSDSQKFQIIYSPSTGYYTVKNIYSGTPIDVTGAIAFNGANVAVWASNESCAQKWNIVSAGGEYFRLASACNSDYSLDVNGAVAKNGTNVQLWKNNDTSAQKWRLIKE